MAAIEVQRVESPEGDPERFAAFAAVFRAIDAERDPGDPPMSDREVAAMLFGTAPDRTARSYLATCDGVPAGYAWLVTVSEDGDELQLAEVDVAVVADHRRRGIARALLAEVGAELVALGQTSVIGYVCPDVTEEAATAVCLAHGMTKRGEERCSRAVVSEVDDGLLDGWTAEAATRAAGYRLRQWEGPCPADLAEAWSVAQAAMEDEPLDDHEYNPYTRTPEVQAEADRTRARHGYRSYRTLAFSPSGEPAGLTEIHVHEDRPQLGHQSDTGVLAEHRGHGLGRWMKAANFRQVTEAHPELAVVETYNAESNPWMLAINEAMGFTPHHAYLGFQGPIESFVEATKRR